MVIDPSAILAILQDEPEPGPFINALAAAHDCLISARSLVELAIAMEARSGVVGLQDLVLVVAGIATVPVDAAQELLASLAFQRFSQGCHPSGLNAEACLSNALATSRREPCCSRATISTSLPWPR
ncbi:MAG: type II toxin-antitoxin system VapC family toxin [Synechococcaceae cyanobacterium]|nr:type II toxin-antitoxin system VapC family toxin [Synechococcaceae cyanobacterium]